MAFDLEDYVPVNERILLFYERFPEGSIRTASMSYRQDPSGWFAVAEVYRSPEDTHPSVGHAFEPVPGKTQFTRDSECMNAETAAWGRAIAAAGIGAQRSLASRDEVRNRQPSGEEVKGEEGQPARPAANSAQIELLANLTEELRQLASDHARVKAWDKIDPASLTPSQADGAIRKTQEAIREIKDKFPELPPAASSLDEAVAANPELLKDVADIPW